MKQVTEAIPQLGWDLDDMQFVIEEGAQAKVIMKDKSARNKILKQTNKLRDTKIWISKELTPTLLKMKATKLAKVRKANGLSPETGKHSSEI